MVCVYDLRLAPPLVAEVGSRAWAEREMVEYERTNKEMPDKVQMDWTTRYWHLRR